MDEIIENTNVLDGISQVLAEPPHGFKTFGHKTYEEFRENEFLFFKMYMRDYFDQHHKGVEPKTTIGEWQFVEAHHETLEDGTIKEIPDAWIRTVRMEVPDAT